MSSATDAIARTTNAPDASRTSRLPPWQPWSALALFSFLLHFVWEMLFVPFYTGMGERPPCCPLSPSGSRGDISPESSS